MCSRQCGSVASVICLADQIIIQHYSKVLQNSCHMQGRNKISKADADYDRSVRKVCAPQGPFCARVTSASSYALTLAAAVTLALSMLSLQPQTSALEAHSLMLAASQLVWHLQHTPSACSSTPVSLQPSPCTLRTLCLVHQSAPHAVSALGLCAVAVRRSVRSTQRFWKLMNLVVIITMTRSTTMKARLMSSAYQRMS